MDEKDSLNTTSQDFRKGAVLKHLKLLQKLSLAMTKGEGICMDQKLVERERADLFLSLTRKLYRDPC